MKKILNIVVAVITCFCILTATTVTAFAKTEEVFIDPEGFEYKVDENGIAFYDYSIPLHIQPLDTIQVRPFALVPGTDVAYTITYEIQDVINATASSGLAGTAATITAASTGTVVLFSILAGCGLMALCEPEYTETVLNDVWYWLSSDLMHDLNEMYWNPTYVLEPEMLKGINEALNKAVYTDKGVTWRQALVLGTSGLTGYADAWSDDFTVVFTGTEEELTTGETPVTFVELPMDGSWVSMDPYNTVSYRFQAQGKWDNNKGKQASASGSSVRATVTMKNNMTGASLTWYSVDSAGKHLYSQASSTYNRYVMQPIYVTEGNKRGISVPFCVKKPNASYYPFTHNNAINLGTTDLPYDHPIRIFGTGSFLDGMLIYKVAWDETKEMWEYTYYAPETSMFNDKKTCYMPMEPFSWVLSQSTPAGSGGDTVLNGEKTDDYGKIVNTNPQIDENKSGLTIKAPEKTTITDDETGKETENSTFTDEQLGTGGNIGTGLGNKVDTDNPDKEQFKDFLKLPFSITGLFDWLPIPHTNLFDTATGIVGSIVLALFVFKVITAFF